MKDLQALANHSSVQSAEKLQLVSDRPIVLLRDGEQRAMGQPLSTQQIGGLLKASLPPEDMAQLQWGREIQLQLPVGGTSLPLLVAMRADKTFFIELTLQPENAATQPQSPITPPVARPTAQPGPVHAPATIPASQPDLELSGPVNFDEELEQQVRMLTEGDNLALIYRHGGNAESIEALIETLGYAPKLTRQTLVAVEALKYGEFPLVILDLGEDFRQDAVYQKLCQMLMDVRRKMFVVLIAPGFSNDTLTAYSLSVNLAIGPADRAHFAEWIEKGVDHWRSYVSVYHHFLQAEGRY